MAATRCLIGHAQAQTPPSAGSLQQQQIERDQQDAQQRRQIQRSDQAAPAAPPVGQTVTDRACHFKRSMTRRLGNNPNAITTDLNRGADQDGTLHRNRFWLTASVAF
jgi:hypothetical protein